MYNCCAITLVPPFVEKEVALGDFIFISLPEMNELNVSGLDK